MTPEPKQTPIDVRALREAEFPWAARGECVYLNNASTGPLPARTERALAEFNARRARPYLVSDEDQLGTLRRARSLAARVIGADTDEIALMVNTSYGINLAAGALPLGAGDVIVAPDLEFPANVYPWLARERHGARLELVPCAGDVPDEEALLRALERPGVRVLAVSWVSFATGYRVDLARLGRACRERGIYLAVDAIQGVGAAELDVHRCHVDVLACGGQKWLLSPWGSGFAYVRRELLTRLVPQDVGWLAMRRAEEFGALVDYDFALVDDARRFEVATLPYQAFAAFNASVDMLLQLGLGAVAARVRALTGRIVDWAAALGHARVRLALPADPARRAGIVSLRVADPSAVSQALSRAGVAHAVREGLLRLAPHVYNTEDEVDRALEVLDRV
ncbi:MAG TPA: aminotransferase class V-fold PLP-dependent enzyme [Gemmatimonadaceae bacterium]|nr:aminotransferase class V-fold PLP-dependent enzyme [Gemmatimonadaceae bacterium]